MLMQPNNEMRNFKRQVLTRVRGLREEREKAADEYASTLVNLRSLRARLQVAEHERRRSVNVQGRPETRLPNCSPSKN